MPANTRSTDLDELPRRNEARINELANRVSTLEKTMQEQYTGLRESLADQSRRIDEKFDQIMSALAAMAKEKGIDLGEISRSQAPLEMNSSGEHGRRNRGGEGGEFHNRPFQPYRRIDMPIFNGTDPEVKDSESDLQSQHQQITVISGTGENTEKDENPLLIQPEIKEEKYQVVDDVEEINQKNEDEWLENISQEIYLETFMKGLKDEIASETSSFGANDKGNPSRQFRKLTEEEIHGKYEAGHVCARPEMAILLVQNDPAAVEEVGEQEVKVFDPGGIIWKYLFSYLFSFHLSCLLEIACRRRNLSCRGNILNIQGEIVEFFCAITCDCTAEMQLVVQLVKEVLVKWKDLAVTDATWEKVRTILDLYPDFHLEDKVNVGEAGIDMLHSYI